MGVPEFAETFLSLVLESRFKAAGFSEGKQQFSSGAKLPLTYHCTEFFMALQTLLTRRRKDHPNK
ncbi:hypothetical protein BaRGS_00010446, partial [Batillaria attramentaria]